MEIDNSLLASLIRSSYKLHCLENAGIDDWYYYRDALNNDPTYNTYMALGDSEVISTFFKLMKDIEEENKYLKDSNDYSAFAQELNNY